MNSAAKLRKPGRATASVAAAALVMTAFGPAAFSWTAGTGGSDSVGVASIGLIDADRSTPRTQGATVVAAGATSQDIGDVRFVFPSNWAAGDRIDFALGNAGTINTTNLNQISFTALPSVNVDTKAYASNTRVHDTSGAADSALSITAPTAGSVEDGLEQPYVVAPGATAPVAPQVVPTIETVGTGTAYRNVLRLTFQNASNATDDAKFIGAINGAKINVGSGVTGDITLGAAGTSADGTSTANLFQDAGGATANVTIPATVGQVRLEVSNGAVTADGTSQYVGPITLSSVTDMSASVPVSVDVQGGARFDDAAPVTATFYDAAGAVVGTAVPATVSDTRITVNTPASGNAIRRVVFSGPAVSAPTGTQTFNYVVTQTGGIATGTSTFLGGTTTALATAPTNQKDIVRPTNLTNIATTATQVPTRLGGQERYQTAVKIAEYDLADGANVVRGESDNVVIASGEVFPDALSAGYLAATKDAQLVLTQKDTLPQTVVEFLKTYGAKNVFIVGGEGVVSQEVENRLRGMQSYDVQVAPEAAGVTTYDVDLLNPQGLDITEPNALNATAPEFQGLTSNPGTGSHTVSVTRDDTGVVTSVSYNGSVVTAAADTADNASYTAAADGIAQVVTLLIGGQTVVVSVPQGTPATAETATGSFTVRTTAVQSQGAVNATDQTVSGSARRVVPLNTQLTVTRLAGANRFETNKKVNMYAAETAMNPVGITVPQYGQAGRKTGIVANGLTPWDALAAGPLVGNSYGQNPIPVILTSGDTMNQYAADQIGHMDIRHLLFIGGESVLPASLAGETTDRGITVNRLGGANRWATGKAVSEFALRAAGVSPANTAPGFGFASATDVKNPYLANGGSINGSASSQQAQRSWADALASGPSAARERTIIALTDSEALPQETRDLLTASRAALDPVIAIGLGAAVSTNAVNAANQAVAN